MPIKSRKIYIIASLAIISLVILAPLLKKVLPIFNSEEKIFEIRDECGIILGNLMHSVKDRDLCKIKCIAKCESSNLDYTRINFTEGTTSCHLCSCYCG